MKRWAALLLCLMLACPAALAETYIVYHSGAEEWGAYALLLTDDGTALTPRGVYGDLRLLTPADGDADQALYAASPAALPADAEGLDEDDFRSFTRLALLDAQGEPLTDMVYYDLRFDPSGVIVGRRYNGPTDVLSPTGATLFSGDYRDLAPAGDGYIALWEDEIDGEPSNAVLRVDADGTEHWTGLHTDAWELSAFSGGLLPLRSVPEYGGRDLFLTEDGEIALGRAFDSISDARGGYAVVNDGDGYALIDDEGNILLPAEYDYIGCEERSDGRAVYFAHRGSAIEIYDGETLDLIAERDFGGSYVYGWLCADGLMNVGGPGGAEIIDMDGDTVVAVPRDVDVSASYGVCRGVPERFVATEGEWPYQDAHLIDRDGDRVGGSFQSLTADLWDGGAGRYTVGTFDIAEDEEGYPYPVWYSNRYGVCDENGETVLPAVYNSVQVLAADRYWVEAPDRSGMIDGAGKWYYVINLYEELVD
ncbi:MAG: WG repeat-containing protein [Clostridia bacterium]|nr:WG repeat-containing protein [Clostridia bacterium]